MLDIAIGVVFIFLLLSVFATTIAELILSSLNMRGKELLLGIQTLLSDESVTGLVQKVYNHGQVYGLFRGEFDPKKKRRNLPSYIPSENFAIALLDSIAQPFSELKPHAAQVPPVGGGLVPTIVQQTATITQAFKTAATALAENADTEKVGKPLMSMIAMAGDDATKLQKSVEAWYNSAMDRVSGWYKYRTLRVLFGIGLVMAVAMNADTIRIVRQLSKDSTMRQSIVAAAEATKNPTGPNDGTGETIDKRINEAKHSFDEINDLGIPVGWPPGDPNAKTPREKIAKCFDWITARPSMLLGWFLTAIAISLGAPFWFDALNKIMVVRSTVKPREKSHDEGSKDKSKS
ncbi:hypothetical protein P8936_15520 [Edaphobacter paludis]|uniref:Uncharacterized protein n=1 Tax=Edaphobacter paludis TaxID=3035702 RepID=A0AAU7CVL5_9BACT